jgi:hypothetical protein
VSANPCLAGRSHPRSVQSGCHRTEAVDLPCHNPYRLVHHNDICRFGAPILIVLRVHQNDIPVGHHPFFWTRAGAHTPRGTRVQKVCQPGRDQRPTADRQESFDRRVGKACLATARRTFRDCPPARNSPPSRSARISLNSLPVSSRYPRRGRTTGILFCGHWPTEHELAANSSSWMKSTGWECKTRRSSAN